jgi:tRNA(Ile)-lysidine synthase TilS/MesJ
LLEELDFDKLALGHHANDQAETVVMKFLRGAGLQGIGGINPQLESVIRPLIELKKEELKEDLFDSILGEKDKKKNQETTDGKQTGQTDSDKADPDSEQSETENQPEAEEDSKDKLKRDLLEGLFKKSSQKKSEEPANDSKAKEADSKPKGEESEEEPEPEPEPQA